MIKTIFISFLLSIALSSNSVIVAQPTFEGSPVEISVELKLYPNPTIDFINIEVFNFKEVGHYEFRNIIGKKLLSGDLEREVTTLNIEEYNKGIYLVSIFDDLGNRLVTKKVLKE